MVSLTEVHTKDLRATTGASFRNAALGISRVHVLRTSLRPSLSPNTSKEGEELGYPMEPFVEL
jgi:hypothetical protein